MQKFPGGWLSLENSNPIPITNYVGLAGLSGGTAQVINSSDFYSPTGGSWVASPISITTEPTVTSIPGPEFPSKQYIVNMMNMQTKMWNGAANVPPGLTSMVYLYGNGTPEPEYLNAISMNFGGSNYDLCQISVYENAATQGDAHGNVEVIDFGAGPFTGAVTLTLTFTDRTGPLNIGIRLESTGNQSSIFELKTIILPTAGY